MTVPGSLIATLLTSWVVTDITPTAFVFSSTTNSALNAAITSNTVTITGINAPAVVTTTGGALISVAGGAFVASPTTIQNNQTLQIRRTSSTLANTLVSTTVTVGTASTTWNMTTGNFDPNFSSVTFLHNMDSSTANVGGAIAAQGSVSFNGNMVTTGATSYGQWNQIGSGFTLNGDFTVEGVHTFTGSLPGTAYLFDFAGQLRVAMSGGRYTCYRSSAALVTSGVIASANTWENFAVTRVGTTLRFYVNGSLVGTSTDGNSVGGTSLTIGNIGSRNYGFNGGFDQFRVTRGVARYTGATMPTPPGYGYPTS